MGRILLVATFIFALPASALCQAHPDNTARMARALMKLENRWVRAVLRHDVKTMDRLLADEYLSVGSDGEVRDKPRTMADFRSSSLSFAAIKLDNFSLRVEGDMYVVSGRAIVKFKTEGRNLGGQFRYAKTYVKRRGRWQVISMHTTRLTDGN